jgi:hypothetical protein
MQFRPSFHQPSLTDRQRAGDQLDRIEAKDRHGILVVRMKVGRTVRIIRLGEHPYDDSEEAT